MNRNPLIPRLLLSAAAALFFVSLFAVSQGNAPLPARFVLMLMVLFSSGIYVAGWLLAAAGWGIIGVAWRRPRRHAHADEGMAPEFLTQIAFGVGVFAMLCWLLGVVGWLTMTTAWVLCVIGWGLLAWQLVPLIKNKKLGFSFSLSHWPILLAVPAAALLIGACTIAPGILWSSEFGGYDALSYHLQLPAEWARDGQIRGLEHNVYSYLPNLFEAAYTHLCVWIGKPWEWAYAAQLLHASMALLTAATIARLVFELTDCRPAGAVSAGVYLATPWTIVTGSLAYNEQAMMLMGAAAMRMVLTNETGWLGQSLRCPSGEVASRGVEDSATATQGLLVGLLCGFAVMMKLTAAGFVVLPVMLVLLCSQNRWRKLVFFSLGAAIPVSIWLIRNYFWTGDNPVFPMFTGVFGTAHWTAEQAARWNAAHSPHTSLGESLGLLFSHDRGLFHPQYAFLFIAAAISAIWLLGCHASARISQKHVEDPPWWTFEKTSKAWHPLLLLLAVVAVQLLFWLTMTHHQPRFLIPLLLPACILIGLAFASPLPRVFARVAAALLVLWLTGGSFHVYLQQVGGAAATYIGTAELMAQSHPYGTANKLPPDARVYCEAHATPFYFNRPVNYHTAWDTSPLGEPLAQHKARLWLDRQRYTHAVVNWEMLSIWTSPNNYGYDPNVTVESLQELIQLGRLEPLPNQPESSPVLIYRVR